MRFLPAFTTMIKSRCHCVTEPCCGIVGQACLSAGQAGERRGVSPPVARRIAHPPWSLRPHARPNLVGQTFLSTWQAGER